MLLCLEIKSYTERTVMKIFEWVKKYQMKENFIIYTFEHDMIPLIKKYQKLFQFEKVNVGVLFWEGTVLKDFCFYQEHFEKGDHFIFDAKYVIWPENEVS